MMSSKELINRHGNRPIKWFAPMERLIETVDDSGGAAGTELNEFCLLWLEAAKAMNVGDEHWAPIVMEVAEGKEYGCRELFLQSGDILLERETLKNIYNLYKERLLNHAAPADGRYDFTGAGFMVHMQQTAIAMQDPEAYEAVLRFLYPNLLKSIRKVEGKKRQETIVLETRGIRRNRALDNPDNWGRLLENAVGSSLLNELRGLPYEKSAGAQVVSLPLSGCKTVYERRDGDAAGRILHHP